jgi:hypothetical protein
LRRWQAERLQEFVPQNFVRKNIQSLLVVEKFNNIQLVVITPDKARLRASTHFSDELNCVDDISDGRNTLARKFTDSGRWH